MELLAAHRKYAKLLEDEIEAWSRKEKIALRVTSFLMGVRGEVSLLLDPPAKRRTTQK